MQRFLDKAGRKAMRQFHKVFRTGAELKRLAASSPIGAKVARAIEDTIHGRLEPDERAAVDVVLSRREALEKDTRPLPADGGREMTVGSVCAQASRPHVWSMLLFHLMRELRPRRAV